MLDVQALRALFAVVEAGSVTAAARRLNYTPSAISQRVAALERAAGVLLLERSGRGVRPTAAGLLLVDHAREIFARLDEADSALAALRGAAARRVTVGAFPSAGASLVPTAVAIFREASAGADVAVTVVDPDHSLERVRGGDLDIAVTLDPPRPRRQDHRGLQRDHLLDDPFLVLLPKRHPLARRRVLDLQALSDDDWIANSSPGGCEQWVIDACHAAGFAPRYISEADDYPAVRGYVAAGLGVALVPSLAAAGLGDGVAARRLRGTGPVRHLFTVTRRPSPSDGPTLAMLRALRAAAKEHRQFRTAKLPAGEAEPVRIPTRRHSAQLN